MRADLSRSDSADKHGRPHHAQGSEMLRAGTV